MPSAGSRAIAPPEPTRRTWRRASPPAPNHAQTAGRSITNQRSILRFPRHPHDHFMETRKGAFHCCPYLGTIPSSRSLCAACIPDQPSAAWMQSPHGHRMPTGTQHATFGSATAEPALCSGAAGLGTPASVHRPATRQPFRCGGAVRAFSRAEGRHGAQSHAGRPAPPLRLNAA